MLLMHLRETHDVTLKHGEWYSESRRVLGCRGWNTGTGTAGTDLLPPPLIRCDVTGDTGIDVSGNQFALLRQGVQEI